MRVVEIGDKCKWGHRIEDDNVLFRMRNGKQTITCKTCKSEQKKRSASTPEARAKARERQKRYAEKTRERQRRYRQRKRDRLAQGDGSILPEEIIALPNHLFLNKHQQEADENFREAVRVNGPGNCKGKWDMYTDAYDNPDEDGDPIAPTEAQVKALCGGCPVVEACLARAMAMRPWQGVEGGRGWVKGKIVA